MNKRNNTAIGKATISQCQIEKVPILVSLQQWMPIPHLARCNRQVVGTMVVANGDQLQPGTVVNR